MTASIREYIVDLWEHGELGVAEGRGLILGQGGGTAGKEGKTWFQFEFQCAIIMVGVFFWL